MLTVFLILIIFFNSLINIFIYLSLPLKIIKSECDDDEGVFRKKQGGVVTLCLDAESYSVTLDCVLLMNFMYYRLTDYRIISYNLKSLTHINTAPRW